MSAQQQLLSSIGSSSGIYKVGTITVDVEGSNYSYPPVVGFAGGGGAGASATAVMTATGTVGADLWWYGNGGFPGTNKWIYSFDCTVLPSTYNLSDASFSGPTVGTTVTVTSSFVTLYDFSTSIAAIGAGFKTGAGCPDGTYTVTASAFDGAYIEPVVEFVMVGGFVSSKTLVNAGLSTTNGGLSNFYIPSFPNGGNFTYVGVNASTTLSRKGLYLDIYGGEFTNDSSMTVITPTNGTIGTKVQDNPFAHNQVLSLAYTVYKVTSVTVNNQGSGYSSAPGISFSGDGAGAAAHANMVLA